jgi:hypothetical protein
VDKPIELWQWQCTDQFGKRRIFPCLLTAEQAKHYQDAERIEGSLEIRRSIEQTSDWLHSLPPSESTAASSCPGICPNSPVQKPDAQGSERQARLRLPIARASVPRAIQP